MANLGEAALYHTLVEELPQTAVISIAHRHSIGMFHHHRVNLTAPDAGPCQAALA